MVDIPRWYADVCSRLEKGAGFLKELASGFRQFGFRSFYSKRVKPVKDKAVLKVINLKNKAFSYKREDWARLLERDVKEVYEKEIRKPAIGGVEKFVDRLSLYFQKLVRYQEALIALRRQDYLERKLEEADEVLNALPDELVRIREEIAELKYSVRERQERVFELEDILLRKQEKIRELSQASRKRGKSFEKFSLDFYKFMDAHSISALILDRDTIKRVNNSFCREFGYSASELNREVIGKDYTKFLTGEKDFWHAYFTNPEPETVEVEVKGKNKKGKATIHKFPRIGYKSVKGTYRGRYEYTIVTLPSIKWEETKKEVGKAEEKYTTT